MKTRNLLRSLIPIPFLMMPLAFTSSSGTQPRNVVRDELSISTKLPKKNDPAVSFCTLQDPQDVVRVDTNLVTIPATVMDRDGRYVTSLDRGDFRVFEDGVEQVVSFFEPIEQPFAVLLLMDNSGSMRNHMANLARAANAFVKQLRPDDQLAVATFSDRGRIQLVLDLRKIKDFHNQILLRSRLGDDFTTTFDAVKLGMKYMKNFQGRRAIVLFSDGEQHGDHASAKSNMREAEEQEAVIYTIRFGVLPSDQPGFIPHQSEKNDLKLMERVGAYMQGLAAKTGGRSYQVENLDSLEETFRTVADELGRQYRLGYYPTRPLESGQRREIRVKLRMPNLVVHSRDSYLVDKDRVKAR